MTDDRKGLEMFTIYLRPRDYPHSYVLRRQVLRSHGQTGLSELVPDPLPLALVLADEPHALTFLRASIPPYCVQVQRPGDDLDPCIHEVWL